jgi:hypothetical protein
MYAIRYLLSCSVSFIFLLIAGCLMSFIFLAAMG